MNGHALAILEFPRLIGLVADRATSALGAEHVRTLSPRTDRAWIEAEHARVSAVRTLAGGDHRWYPEPLPDLRGPLSRLRVEGARWTGVELLAGAQLLRSSRRTREFMRDVRRPVLTVAVLRALVERLVVARPAEDVIERTLAEDGSVRDEASPSLRSIRRELRAAHGQLIRILERAMERLDAHHRVTDMSVTVRNGRYVIPVRREGRAAVGGIVHDASSTGATVFVEPPAAVEFMNRIRELEVDEQEEVDRILAELTDTLRPLREPLLDAIAALAELDALFARARYANEFGCTSPPLVPAREGFAIYDGRHPLLVAQGIEVVPFDLAMDPGEHTLLVSGPNTGGKTVLLKALGLLSAMAQAGVPTTAGPESRVPIFDDCFADVGDEQSIEASLSTFSAHLRNLAEILRLATRDSLVLVDELGSGTDPTEGAALGWAIVEELTRRGTTSVITTHLGTLKELAGQVPGVVNASLQFDAVALAPTYRLVKGIPGRSYGISIARRLRLPEHVVDRAEERLPQQERDVAALVERLEQQEAALSAREAEAHAMADDARTKLGALRQRESTLRERERLLEKASRQEARRYLLDARKEIDRTIKELKRSAEQSAEAVDAVGREARARAERLAEGQATQLDRLEREEANAQRRAAQRAVGPRREAPPAAPLAVGDAVEVGTLAGKLGRLLEIRGKDALVAVGVMKLTVPLSALRRTERPQEQARVLIGDAPEPFASTEVDLRGIRVDEVDGMLLPALDAAVQADLGSLRIIHGMGTGALAERVAELLQKDTRVRSRRFGRWNEGGVGVTIAELE